MGKPSFAPDEARGDHGERVVVNEPTDAKNELYVDRDIMVLANPEISGLPDWVVAWLPPVVWRRPSPPRRVCCWWCRPVFLTTCSSVGCFPTSLKRESCGRASAIVGAVVVAGWLGIDPPGFVAEVVAFAFGLAASTFFPVIVLGIFSTRMNKQGGGGNGHGPSLYGQRVVWFRFLHPELDTAEHWWFGIGPKGIGSVGMLLNFVVSVAVGACFPRECQHARHGAGHPGSQRSGCRGLALT